MSCHLWLLIKLLLLQKAWVAPSLQPCYIPSPRLALLNVCQYLWRIAQGLGIPISWKFCCILDLPIKVLHNGFSGPLFNDPSPVYIFWPRLLSGSMEQDSRTFQSENFCASKTSMDDPFKFWELWVSLSVTAVLFLGDLSVSQSFLFSGANILYDHSCFLNTCRNAFLSWNFFCQEN